MGACCHTPSRGSSQPRAQTQVSYVSFIVRQVLYHSRHLGSPVVIIILVKILGKNFVTING